MKKKISILCVILLLASLCGTGACSARSSDPAARYLGGSESFTLTADKETVSPGDTVTVTLRADNCKNVACFDVRLFPSDNAVLTSSREKPVGDFIVTLTEADGGAVLSAIIATTGDIDGQDLMTATFTVAENAVPGDTVTFRAEFSEYLVGTDASGDETADATALVSAEPLTVTVA